MNRPTRSQQTLLSFIEQFVKQHKYGPTYREIMRALDYKSVSTVATHVNGLIAKGQLKKHGRSARSLEVISQSRPTLVDSAAQESDCEAWLSVKLEAFIASTAASEASLEAMVLAFDSLDMTASKAKAKAALTSLKAKKG